MYRKAADTYIARLLMVCFFLPMAVQVIALLAAAGYFLIAKVIDKYKAPLAGYGWAFCLSAGFYLYILWLPGTSASARDTLLMLCQHKLSYLLMPFFFATISPGTRALIRGQLSWFVYGCVACLVVAHALYIYHFCIVPGTISHLFHVQYRLYIEDVTSIHPTYLSMYICFAVSILLLLPEEAMRAWVKYLLLYVLFIFLFSLLAKSALLAMGIILVHYAFVQRNMLLRYKYQLAGAVIALAGVLYFIPFFGQRMGEVLQFAGIGKHGGDITDNSLYVRKVIWHTDMQMLHQYWLGGVGPAALQHTLSIRYFFISIAQHFFVGYYDPHNEYLNEWLSFGLAGIAILILVLCLHIFKALRNKDHLYLYLLIILCITFATETVLARQCGVIFYSVLTALFFFTRRQQQESHIGLS